MNSIISSNWARVFFFFFLSNKQSFLSSITLQIYFCFSFAEHGEVYTWGWKECIPSGKVFGESSTGVSLEKDVPGRHTPLFTEQGMFDLFTMTAYVQLVVPPKEWSKQAKVHQKRSGGYMIESLESEKKEEKRFYGFTLYDEPSFPTWMYCLQ